MKKYSFILLINVLIFSSCLKEIDSSSLKLKDKLVVNLLAVDNAALSVHIGKSSTVFDSLPEELIEGAKVVVLDDKGISYPLSFDMVTQSYKSSWIPKSGVTYELQVTDNKLGYATGSFNIPQLIISGKSKWKDSTSKDKFGFYTGTIEFAINDDASERNYYEIGLFRYDDVVDNWLELQILPQNPEFIDNQTKNSAGALLIQDGSFNGQNKVLKFSTPYGTAGSKYKYLVVIKNLSEEYYRYFKSIENYKQQQGIFSEPSAVYTNIFGGLGICAGASIVKDTIQ